MAEVEKFWESVEGPIKRQVTAIVLGCGQRGRGYARFALDLPGWLKIVGVADPVAHRRNRLAEEHGIMDKSLILDDWRGFVSKEKVADVAFICTQDKMHKEPSMALAQKGYHLLLEKPMAVYESDCEQIAEAAEAAGVMVAVCHVLRYYPPAIKVKEIIDKDLIGQVVTVDHRENILWWHFAHSFVRGNWRNVEGSTFSLLAKSCHDIDLIMFWLGDMRCTKIHSFGGLYHFKKDQKPPGAAGVNACFDCPAGVEKACPYSAKKIYLERYPVEKPKWPMSVVCDVEDVPGGYRNSLTKALQSGPYGRCVYECDNNVVDHQVVSMEFESGANASFTMNAFTKNMCRETRICGTKGELRWDGSPDAPIVVHDFTTDQETLHHPDKIVPEMSRLKGHGGADFFLISAFVRAVAFGDPTMVSSGIRDSLRSHKLVFAAEKSRLNNTIETVDI